MPPDGVYKNITIVGSTKRVERGGDKLPEDHLVYIYIYRIYISAVINRATNTRAEARI